MDHSSILERLKTQGFRLTAARKQLVELFGKECHPVSAADVLAMLKKHGLNVNTTTAYRELTFLEEQGIIRSVHFQDGVQRYESADLPHHHHAICVSCHRVEDIEMEHNFSAVERQIKKQKNFAVSHHSLEFYGRCGRCG